MRRTIFRSPKCWRAGFKKKPQNPQNHRVVIKVVTKSPCFFDFCYSSQSSRQLFGVWSQLYFGIWTRNKVANEGNKEESSSILVRSSLLVTRNWGEWFDPWRDQTTVNCVSLATFSSLLWCRSFTYIRRCLFFVAAREVPLWHFKIWNIFIYTSLGGGNSNIFLFSPWTLGRWCNLTSICFKWVGSTTN